MQRVNIPKKLLDEYGRLLSLDFFRGFVMFMLIPWFLWHDMGVSYFDGTILETLHTQVSHAQWNGLHFWDLVQPFFMFIVGVAMPISFGKRWDRGDSWPDTLKHAGKRSLILLALGIALHQEPEGGVSFALWNVLAQLAFTYFIAFLIMRKTWKFQLSFSIGLLVLTELLYRLWPVTGFSQPFTPDHNFGTWLDLVITGHLNGHWVAVNALPTSAHTIWGVLAGQLLISKKQAKRKMRILVGAGITGLIIGYALDPITPIIKKIATSSFTIVSGGWCLLALAFSFWMIDVKKYQLNTARFFSIAGMNALFAYIISSGGVGVGWFHNIVDPFIEGLLSLFHLPLPVITLFADLAIVVMMWYMLWFLYKKRIFISI